jgi:hypothetical protein
MLRKSLALAAVTAVFSSLPQTGNASPLPVAPPPHIEPVDDSSLEAREFLDRRISASLRPGDIHLQLHFPADRDAQKNIARADERLTEINQGPVTGGIESKSFKDYKQAPASEKCEWFCNPSVFTDYSYINIDDHRKFGSDGYTNSWSGGFDFTTKYDILLGALYSFSHDSLGSAFLNSETHTDSHFVSIYAAKSFLSFLNVGVSGSYGHSEIESELHAADGFRGRTTASNVDTWNVSPFVGVSHRWGAFSTSFTTSYLYSMSDTSAPNRDTVSHTGKVAFDLKLGYAITERLKLVGTARYTQAVVYEEADRDFPEDRSWATFGGKIIYRVTDPLELFAQYAYDAFNTSYDNHTVRGGMSYSF